MEDQNINKRFLNLFPSLSAAIILQLGVKWWRPRQNFWHYHYLCQLWFGWNNAEFLCQKNSFKSMLSLDSNQNCFCCCWKGCSLEVCSIKVAVLSSFVVQQAWHRSVLVSAAQAWVQIPSQKSNQASSCGFGVHRVLPVLIRSHSFCFTKGMQQCLSWGETASGSPIRCSSVYVGGKLLLVHQGDAAVSTLGGNCFWSTTETQQCLSQVETTSGSPLSHSSVSLGRKHRKCLNKKPSWGTLNLLL